MPDDLRTQIIAAIAASGDENYKRLLMLLLRVEEIFLEKVDELHNQLIPVSEHVEDHAWIKDARDIQGGVKTSAVKILQSLLEKGAWVFAGVMAARFFGVNI